MSVDASHLFTNRQFERINVLQYLMEEQVYPILAEERNAQQNLQPWDRYPTFMGLYLRAMSWVRSATRLNEPTDLQLILTCVRSLMETSVDLQLLRADPGNPGWQMYHWERSALLKAALAQRTYYQCALPREGRAFPADLPAATAPIMEFINREEATILNMRRTLWPNHIDPRNNNARHPERWTGSGNLLEDVRAADRVGGVLIRTTVGTPLEELYETEYRRLSWNVHGSSLAGIRNLTEAGIITDCGYGYACSTRLGLLCTKLVVDEFGIADRVPLIQDAIDRIASQNASGTANNSGTSGT